MTLDWIQICLKFSEQCDIIPKPGSTQHNTYLYIHGGVLPRVPSLTLYLFCPRSPKLTTPILSFYLSIYPQPTNPSPSQEPLHLRPTSVSRSRPTSAYNYSLSLLSFLPSLFLQTPISIFPAIHLPPAFLSFALQAVNGVGNWGTFGHESDVCVIY